MSPPDSGPDASGCLSDDVLMDLADGRLASAALASAHRHAAGCDACRQAMAMLARGGVEPPPPEPKPAPPAEEKRPPGLAWTPPQEFDGFRLERFLDRGGMGIVYVARELALDRPVAIKFIASSQPEARMRAFFEAEARIIARLQHPNVVTVFRAGEVAGHPYIVTEYIAGRSLAKLPLPLTWRRVLSLGIGLAGGLAAAHREGVLHRDIKPSNVVVTDADEVKLLDFGLAERFAPDAPSPGPRTLAGSLPYMAPELFQGAPASPQSDLYALGLVLQELCTGEPPARRRPDDAPAIPSLGGGIDPDFAALIARCLAPEPSRRFASADALLEALERVRPPPEPPEAGNPYRGLEPFEAEHQASFFGRDADIRAVLDRLRRQPLVLVAGSSGTGKSSLCRAGVLPRAAKGGLDERRTFSTLTLWPGRHPLHALAAALAPVLGRKEAELAKALAQPSAWLGQALREAHRERGLLLFVDQLEEVITLAEPAEAERFAAVLGELALPSEGVRVLLALRGDFLTRICALPGLGDEADRALYVLRPMTPEGVREAVVGPARGRGVVFESDALIRTLVASTHGAGSLPLLQFALAELWDRRDTAQKRITRAALEEMGGVAGALSRHADGVLERLSAAEREAARRLLLQLVTAESTGAERPEEELVAPGDAASRAALRVLVEGRLVQARTAGGHAAYAIAHDSLIDAWGKLRNWLDDDIGHRALRQRVAVASAEWQRVGRPRESLWGQRQLDEVRPLDLSSLPPREHAFVVASQVALARRRRNPWLAAILVASLVGAVYGGLRVQAFLEQQRFIAAQLDLARQALADARDLAQLARTRREGALALFDGKPPPASLAPSFDPTDPWRAAEGEWAEALDALDHADAALARAAHYAERALERERDPGAHRLLVEITYERLLLAETFHQRRASDERMRQLTTMVEDAEEDLEWRQRLAAPSELKLVTEPPGATVTLHRYASGPQGARRLEPASGPEELGVTPLSGVWLPAGSYLLHVTRPDRAPVELPLLLERGGHERIDLALPGPIPAGYVYVPPGCFLMGSEGVEEVRKTQDSAPMHRFCIDQGYLISRTEVTFGDWLAYLKTLKPGAPARTLLAEPGFNVTGVGAVVLRPTPAGGWAFSFRPSSERGSRDEEAMAREGEPFRYADRSRRSTADWRRFPLSGVSARELEGYLSWLDTTGQLPGARLCREDEWERAARGADGRAFPHGDRLGSDDANIDVTYGRRPRAFGPDEVGSHPVSKSPFGLEDMAGNAMELTRPMTPAMGRIVLRGGSWYVDTFMAHTSNRLVGTYELGDARVGVRICASFSPGAPGPIE